MKTDHEEKEKEKIGKEKKEKIDGKDEILIFYSPNIAIIYWFINPQMN